jgi:hypothetical protein
LHLLSHDTFDLETILEDTDFEKTNNISLANLLDLAKRKTYFRKRKLELPPTTLHLKALNIDQLIAMVRGLKYTAETLAVNLSLQRHYFHLTEPSDKTPLTCEYDPRFLVFEFICNFLLHKRQVELVNFFYETVTSPPTAESITRQAAVQQMIMGAGKTTVVGPLLALLCADGKSLVNLVVPDALLEMSRNRMRTVFSHVLHKQVYTLHYDRSSKCNSKLYHVKNIAKKMERALHDRSIVCTTPAAVKSLMLMYIHLLSKLEGAEELLKVPQKVIVHRKHFRGLEKHKKKFEETREVANQLGRVIKLWGNGVVLLDEVDLLLHPLKSELNFPIGEKHPLYLCPERYQLPLHLFDGFLYHQDKRVSTCLRWPLKKDEVDILNNIGAALKLGEEQLKIQKNPNYVLLDKEFYEKNMKSHVASWALVWLLRHPKINARVKSFLEGNKEVDQGQVKLFLHKFLCDKDLEDETTTLITGFIFSHVPTSPADGKDKEVTKPDEKDKEGNKDEAKKDEAKAEATEAMQILNLARQWITNFFTHCISKLYRINYGILKETEIDHFKEENGDIISKSRSLLAVPFVGKDCPSRASEFSHPEVLIGLSVLAYRYEGLRQSDVRDLVLKLQEESHNEGGSMKDRASVKLFHDWVELAKTMKAELQAEKKKKELQQRGEIQDDEQEKENEEDEEDIIPPLNQFQPSRDSSILSLWKLIRKVPAVLHYYLDYLVFPTVLKHQILKLTASGHDLGSEMLFRARVGFSGTPSDILPRQLGKCHFEPRSEGDILRVLTDPEIVVTKVIQETGVENILRYVAHGNFNTLIGTSYFASFSTDPLSLLSHFPPFPLLFRLPLSLFPPSSFFPLPFPSIPLFSRLQDTGALITGMSNEQVARKLLKIGLKGKFFALFLKNSRF